MATFFPAFFPVSGQRVVIVGGGDLAARKARLVAGEDVDIVFFARETTPAFEAEWAAAATIERRLPEADDFRGAALAFVALEDDDLAARIGADARRAGIPTNVVDQPAISDFYTPSIVKRGDVTVAISTGGVAPVLGKRLRAQIEALLPARLDALAGFAKSFRSAVANTIPAAWRRGFWEDVFDGPIAENVLDGNDAAAREQMIAALNSAAAQKRPQGVVHIVGAGPGDPELLTLRALRLIQRADAIVYDRLVGDAIMAMARRDADRIYVGKAKADHAVPQDQIEALLIKLAGEGKNVVRLKGGDPFVFGRGGEELETLRAAGIDAFVTPGITAATGCAASIGMPLTHRDHAQSVTFVTGHAKGDLDPDLDWQALSDLKNTLVIYMGVGKAAAIQEKLIAHGRAPTTPAAIVENGARPNEKAIKGTLGELAEMIAAGGVVGPALLIVGEVAQLADAASLQTLYQEQLRAVSGAAREPIEVLA